MRSLSLTLLLTALSLVCSAQAPALVQSSAIRFSLPLGADTIDFLIVDTVLEGAKPVFLWCQGSRPHPLFFGDGEAGGDEEGRYFFAGGGISNFDYRAIAKDYRLVVISMPETPVLADRAHLNANYEYIPNPNKPGKISLDYVVADTLDNYVQRAQHVLDFLVRQSWVDSSRVVVAGHSQGAKVATKLAKQEARVSHLGLFAANPFGRVDQSIREARLQAQLGRISWTKADSIINGYYAFYRKVHDPVARAEDAGLNSWRQFSETFYDDWLELDIPIYLAYGTEDRTADLCDLVPLFFIERGKDNLTFKRYLNLEHNFFELSENGRPDYGKDHWPQVMRAFVEWIEH